jgi:hypothetical protein
LRSTSGRGGNAGRSTARLRRDPPTPDPDRSARLQLATAALRGILAGIARAFVTWLIEEHIL